jgi:hypothetical protein
MDFVSSESYTGKKSGYVFKTGDLGTGYYLDVKPQIDPSLVKEEEPSQLIGTGGCENCGSLNDKMMRCSGW